MTNTGFALAFSTPESTEMNLFDAFKCDACDVEILLTPEQVMDAEIWNKMRLARHKDLPS